MPRAPTATVDYGVKSLVNESEPNCHAPFCCTYTSVTMKVNRIRLDAVVGGNEVTNPLRVRVLNSSAADDFEFLAPRHGSAHVDEDGLVIEERSQ